MQMFMLCRRYEQHRLAVEMAWGEQGIVVVQDRPIYGDTVFAMTATERGFMTREEFELYEETFRNMSRDIMPPDVFVYLDVSPDECYRRMEHRARKEEGGVPLDYLEHLDRNYKKLLKEMRGRGVRTLVVDWNGFGPPLELWKTIVAVVEEEQAGFHRLSFAVSKHPELPSRGVRAGVLTSGTGETD
jgi:deoxyadenosine/deoxycytidine kinase